MKTEIERLMEESQAKAQEQRVAIAAAVHTATVRRAVLQAVKQDLGYLSPSQQYELDGLDDLIARGNKLLRGE